MPGALLQTVADAALDLIYPASCGLCGKIPESSSTSSRLLCRECLESLDLSNERGCPQCGAKLGPYAPESSQCIHCRNDRFAFEETVCLGTYDGHLRRACLQCKTARDHSLTVQMGDQLYELHQELLEGWEVDCVTCVPQHWRKRLTGGYNTSAELAEQLGNRLKVPLVRSLLTKTQHTSDQSRLTPRQRRENLKGVFRLNLRRVVAGRRILLVDDVLTTGSTANACAKVLKKAGAEVVFVAVLARGLG